MFQEKEKHPLQTIIEAAEKYQLEKVIAFTNDVFMENSSDTNYLKEKLKNVSIANSELKIMKTIFSEVKPDIFHQTLLQYDALITHIENLLANTPANALKLKGPSLEEQVILILHFGLGRKLSEHNFDGVRKMGVVLEAVFRRNRDDIRKFFCEDGTLNSSNNKTLYTKERIENVNHILSNAGLPIIDFNSI